MNIYEYHTNPQELDHYKDMANIVPDIYLPTAFGSGNRLSSQQEKVIARNPDLSLIYAGEILGDEFPLGEPAIATNALLSYSYAVDVIHKPFPLGEPAIKTNELYWAKYLKFKEQYRFK